MPFYHRLRRELDDERGRLGLKESGEDAAKRVSTRILELRAHLDAQLPSRSPSTLLLATWNIREFDQGARAKYGGRLLESLYYITEVFNRFDLIAVQEVRDDLYALEHVISNLGWWWDYLVTDVTLGSSGNSERLAFVYDTRRVAFTGLAGELVLPPKKTQPVLQFARTPFSCGFRSGWTSFALCTVHIYYGDGIPEDPRRVQEIKDLAAKLAERAKDMQKLGPTRSQRTDSENLVLLGDFNIFSQKDATFGALVDNGFIIPKQLQARPGSNLDQSKFYDQIAFMTNPRRFEFSGKAGVLNYNDILYRPEEEDFYQDAMEKLLKYKEDKTGVSATKPAYKMWRTFQMSDHLPLWCELRTDFTTEYLKSMADGELNHFGGAVPADGTPRKRARAKKKVPKKSAKKKAAKSTAKKKSVTKKRPKGPA